MGFRVGQQVMTIMGKGVVKEINKPNYTPYTVVVEVHDKKMVQHYMPDGRVTTNAELPSLYPLDLAPTFYAPELQPKEGEWCWFWDDEKDKRGILQFQMKTENGYYSTGVVGAFANCAPFDGNMTPPWEKEVKG